MSARHDVGLTREWLRAGTAHFRATLDSVTDDQFPEPSALPGWTRAHVVGHVARNAEALARLAVWARTGAETPMYPFPGQRAADIEESAMHSATALRTEVASTAVALDKALDALSPNQWGAAVRSALGREIPATEVPWIRVREVWLHAVDLNAGATVHDLPAAALDALIEDVADVLSAKDSCPQVVLAPTDRQRTWELKPHKHAAKAITADRPVLSAPAALIAGWLTGRVAADTLLAPNLPKWI